MKYEYFCIKYDYGKEVNLPCTLPSHKQSNNVILDNALVEGLLDYFFYSKYSMPSPGQPGFSSYVFTGIMKWTWDKRALNKINSVFSPRRFPSLRKMTGT